MSSNLLQMMFCWLYAGLYLSGIEEGKVDEEDDISYYSCDSCGYHHGVFSFDLDN